MRLCFASLIFAFVTAAPAAWATEVCDVALHNGAVTVTYTGVGESRADVERLARNLCRLEHYNANARWHCSHSVAQFANCHPYDNCRVLRQSGPKDHHTNACKSRGYLGYDPTPEKSTLAKGVCFARAECSRMRKGVDPF